MKKQLYVNYLLLAFAIATLFSACTQEQEEGTDMIEKSLLLEEELTRLGGDEGKDFFKMPDSDDYRNIPQDAKNPITADKVRLGQLLFHETGIAIDAKYTAGMHTYSCASCHHAGAGFQGGMAQSIADGGLGFGFNGQGRFQNFEYHTDSLDVQPVRSPSILNSAFQTNMLWNGMFGAKHENVGTEDKWDNPDIPPLATNHLGFEGVETQAIAGLKVHRMRISRDFLIMHEEYRNLFENAFGLHEIPESDSINRIYAGLAIAAYERTVMANEAPFQKWLDGTETLSEQQLDGALLFFGKANCVQCHTGPALNSMTFAALGFKDFAHGDVFKHENKIQGGRGGFTGLDDELYAFKVPQLYNLKDSPFYGHGASFQSVKEVVEYKNKAIPEHPEIPPRYMDERFTPLELTEIEMDAITDFIENGLHDPTLAKRYVPESVPSGFCFPNNDLLSKRESGCE